MATVINGEYIINGYIDIGRVDSMLDLLVETLGALVFAVIYAIDKGVHTSFHLITEKKEEPLAIHEQEQEVAVSE